MYSVGFVFIKFMAYNLFLDDERKPLDVTWVKLPLVEWTVVRNYNEFVKVITENGLPEFISFDHDLALEHYAHGQSLLWKDFDYSKVKEPTGLACAVWLVDYCIEKNLPIPKFEVHSMNPIGTHFIRRYLQYFNRYKEKPQDA